MIRRRAGIISQGLPSLQSRREEAARNLHMSKPQHPLHDLLPPTSGSCVTKILSNQTQIGGVQGQTNRQKLKSVYCDEAEKTTSEAGNEVLKM